MAADHLRPHRHGFSAGAEQERLFAAELFDRHSRDLGGRVDADRQRGPGVVTQELGRAGVIGVENRESLDGEIVEYLRLRLAIFAQRGVIVEMVVGDVGHAGGVEFQAGHTRLVQGVAGNLHHRVRAAVANHPRQQRCQPLGRRRRMG